MLSCCGPPGTNLVARLKTRCVDSSASEVVAKRNGTVQRTDKLLPWGRFRVAPRWGRTPRPVEVEIALSVAKDAAFREVREHPGFD